MATVPVCTAGPNEILRQILIGINEVTTGVNEVSEEISSGGLSGCCTYGSLTDRSGTTAVANTSQQIMAANPNRKYLIIENVSSGDLWFNFGVAANQTQPSLKLLFNGSFVMESNFISTESVHVVAATAGKAYTAKEG